LKRPREDPARRGEQARSGRWCTAKKSCPRTTLIPRSSERAHGAASHCGPHRSTPLVVWMRGRGSKGLKSLHLGPPWASLHFAQNAVSPERPSAPHAPLGTPPITTTHAQLLSFGLCRCKSTPTCPRCSERCRQSCLERALASPWPLTPRFPRCRTCSRGG